MMPRVLVSQVSQARAGDAAPAGRTGRGVESAPQGDGGGLTKRKFKETKALQFEISSLEDREVTSVHEKKRGGEGAVHYCSSGEIVSLQCSTKLSCFATPPNPAALCSSNSAVSLGSRRSRNAPSSFPVVQDVPAPPSICVTRGRRPLCSARVMQRQERASASTQAEACLALA